MKHRMYVTEQARTENTTLHHYDSMNIHIHGRDKTVHLSTWMPALGIWVRSAITRNEAASLIRKIRSKGEGKCHLYRD